MKQIHERNGDDDHLFSADEACELRAWIRNSHLLNIPFAGHVVFAEQKQVCIDVIRQALESKL